MAATSKKDGAGPVETTGHEWDGIQEYNKPLPKWWVYTFYATIIWSIGYYVLYPSWPSLNGYFSGLLGYSQRAELAETMAAARAAQAGMLGRIEAAEPAAILADPDLRTFAIAGGRAAFADNCVACHGPGGGGRSGYPTLADDDWLWGGTIDQIHETLLYGIRHDHAETRISEMPAFGADKILTRAQIADVADYVLSLSGRATDRQAVARGSALYAENCAACHGDKGQGDKTLGAPALDDSIWLYGGDREAIIAQISRPRHGVMPAWVDRLDPATIKMLSVYVHSLGGGQ